MDLPDKPVSQPPSANPLGRAGAVVSILGLGTCLAALTLVMLLGASKTPIQSSEPDHYLVTIPHAIEDGLTFVGQAILFVMGGLVGGTLSLVGLGLSAAGLRRLPNRSAKIGLLAGLAGPLLLVIWLLTFWLRAAL